MRRPLVLVGLVAALALVVSTAPAAPGPFRQAGMPRADAVERVLFVGNSFTYFNNLPEVLAGIARSRPRGPAIEPTMFATGGMTLQWHWAAGKAAALIDAERWDHVVLQEQSALGAGTETGDGRLSPPGLFHQSVRSFVPRIRAVGAAPVLLMTWARRARPTDQALLADAYDTIGRELGVTVSPAGLAWQEARRQWPDLELHVADGSHPNPVGTYLAACVLYVTLTGHDPRGAAPRIDGHPYSRALQDIDRATTVTLVGLEPALARRLQALAWAVASQRTIGKG